MPGPSVFPSGEPGVSGQGALAAQAQEGLEELSHVEGQEGSGFRPSVTSDPSTALLGVRGAFSHCCWGS